MKHGQGQMLAKNFGGSQFPWTWVFFLSYYVYFLHPAECQTFNVSEPPYFMFCKTVPWTHCFLPIYFEQRAFHGPMLCLCVVLCKTSRVLLIFYYIWFDTSPYVNSWLILPLVIYIQNLVWFVQKSMKDLASFMSVHMAVKIQLRHCAPWHHRGIQPKFKAFLNIRKYTCGWLSKT